MSDRPQPDRVNPLSDPTTPQTDLDELWGRAAKLLERLASCTDADLSTLERRRLGGFLSRNTPAMVAGLARAMEQYGPAFSALTLEGSGADLRARQERADAWRRLRDLLQLCAEQAGDAYLREQAEAQRVAQAILTQVQAEVDFARKWRRPLPMELDLQVALCPVIDLKERETRRRRHAGQRRARQRKAKQAPPVG
jgi:hypothetical protein